MDILDLREFCLSFPETREETPFDDKILVYKVSGKIFALTDMVECDVVIVKCDPELAIELREQYEEIEPAFHMNKKHWNQIRIDGDMPADKIRDFIRSSFLLVVQGLPRGERDRVSKLYIDHHSD